MKFASGSTILWQALALLILFTPTFVLGQDSKCGSLITYRQHSILLSEAPQCFRNGCNSANSTGLATSISSPCPSDAPCSVLWDILRQKFQQDWCASCSSDIACRIGGWPILNMTAACNFSPNDWIFDGSGGCCASGDEPFLIVDWIETLCNGSEWRAPFTYYGGMAKEDWEEWIEPWNWTLRPQNTSTKNFSDSDCDSASLLWSLGIENFTKIAGFIFNSGLAILLKRIFGIEWGPINKDFHWWGAIIGGVSDFATTFSGNVGASFILKYSPGYAETPVGELVLLFGSRPSVLGFLCALGIVAIIFEDGRWADPQLRRFAADTVASLAICEFLQQIVGSAYLGRTANVGRRKDFFHVGHLTPFWRGSEAQRMYAGGLIWTILSPFTILGLIYLAYLQVQKLYHEQALNPQPSRVSWPVRFLTRQYLKFMNRFFENKWRYHDARARQQPEMTEAARATDRLLPGAEEAPEDQNMAQAATGAPRSGLFSRLGNRRPIRWFMPPFRWVGNRLIIVSRFFSWLTNKRPIRWLLRPFRWVWSRPYMRTTSRIMAARPLRWLTTVPYLYIFADDLRAQRHAEAHGQTIDAEILRRRQGLDAITRQVLSKYPAPAARVREPTDTLRDIRVGFTSWMVILWVIIYIAQWLFWSGFVQSSGPRWCPPQDDWITSKIRIVLAVLSFAGISLNFFFNY